MGVRRKRRLPMIVPLTSMGDIAFLLIIFFILAGIPKGQRSLTPPEAPGLGEIQAAVTVSMDENGKCYLQGDIVAVPALQGMVRDHLETRKSKLVVVEIDKSLPFEAYSEVLMAVSEAGGTLGARGIKIGP